MPWTVRLEIQQESLRRAFLRIGTRVGIALAILLAFFAWFIAFARITNGSAWFTLAVVCLVGVGASGPIGLALIRFPHLLIVTDSEIRVSHKRAIGRKMTEFRASWAEVEFKGTTRPGVWRVWIRADGEGDGCGVLLTEQDYSRLQSLASAHGILGSSAALSRGPPSAA